MGNESKTVDRLLEPIPGGLFGLLSVFIIIIADLFAILFFPGYNFFENMVSELGVGPGGFFFNLGLILSGIIAIPFYLHLSKTFIEENVNENIRKTAITSSMISCISYTLLGFFPTTEINNFLYNAHGILATISISSGICYLVSFSSLMLHSNRFKKSQAYLGLFTAGLYAFFLSTWWPIVEWIMSLSIMAWIVINSIYCLYHKF